MEAVKVKLNKGSRADPVILLLAVMVCVFGGLLQYETDFWARNEYAWEPVVLIGAFLFLIYFVRRLFSGNLQFALISDDVSHLIFQKAEHITMSGWVLGTKECVEKKDVVSVKVENFYSYATHAGMYWVCFTMKDRSVIEYRINDCGIINKIREFVATAIPDAELAVGKRA